MDVGRIPSDIQNLMPFKIEVTRRAIRYALAELIKQGRAKRKGQQGPVYAVTK